MIRNTGLIKITDFNCDLSNRVNLVLYLYWIKDVCNYSLSSEISTYFLAAEVYLTFTYLGLMRTQMYIYLVN